MVEALTRRYRNTNMTVSKHATYARLHILCSGSWHVDEVLAELDKGVTMEELQVGSCIMLNFYAG